MYKQLRIREVSENEEEKEHVNGENERKIPKISRFFRETRAS